MEYPRFVKRISPVRVMDGEKVTFSCVVTGKPIPKVEWYHNDVPVKEAKDVIIYQDTEGVCTLAISEVFPENAGEYSCRAVNRVGEAICKSSLIVEAYEYVPDSELGIITGSEEDLLADKTISDTDFLSDSDVECAPRIIKKLPQVISTKDGDVTRLEVKAIGKPKPEGKWLKHGTEIIPSNEFVIENLEDGTSILTITEVYPDDSGEITFEAHNPLGVAVTSTELLIETTEGIIGTKEYRKPEWVTHMEELSAALKAAQSAPTFVQEITDIRTTEAETIKFECLLSGTPTPDIIWYHNDKIIRNTKRVKVRIEDNKTSVTISEVTDEDTGTYLCKAVSEIGVAVTKAKLYVQEIPEYKKAEILLRKAQEEEEKIKQERIKITKKRVERRKQRTSVTTEEEIKPLDVTQVQAIETTEQIVETLADKVKAIPTLDIQEPLKTEAVATCKKIDESPEEKLGEKATEILSPVEPTYSEQILTEEIIKDIEKIIPKTRKARPGLQTGVSEFVDITEVKLEQIIERCEKIIRRGELKMAKEVSQILELINVKEFGPGESPLREIAEIGYLVRNGITVKEITVLYDENKFPSLKSPQAQSAMVNVVERKGHGALISEVLTEETTIDERQLAATVGFRAFMKMVEANYVTIEEVITHFTPEDFIQRAWESAEVNEGITKTVSEMLTISEEIEVLEDSGKTVKKTIKKKGDIEETLEVKEDIERTAKGAARLPKKKHSVEITDITELLVDKKETELESTAKIKHDSKKESDIEIEIEEIEETERGEKRHTDDLIPFEMPTIKQIPINTTNVISETTGLREVAQINKSVTKSTATIDILPHTAVVEEHTVAQENEELREEVTCVPTTATKTVDTIEAVEVAEQNIHNIPGHFEDTFKPISSTALENILPNESISVHEITLGDIPSNLPEEELFENKANLTVIPQEAKNISEVEVSINAQDLLPFEIITQQQLPINMIGSYSEAISMDQVTQKNEEVQKLTAEVDIIPLSAVVEEHTHIEESEGLHTKLEPTTFSATKTYDTVEAFEVSEQTIQNLTGQFDSQFKPILSNASANIVSSEGISVQEINLGDITSLLPEEQNVVDLASITLLPQETKTISEVEVSHKEQLLDEFTIPKSAQAIGTFSTKEGINVEEIYQKISEETLDTTKPTTIKPKYKIDSNESIVVEEVLSEVKPGKYLPEAFVATEIASKNIVPQKSITQLEMVAPEVEGEYIPGRLPPTQRADFNITLGESILVSQTDASERGKLFEKAASPEKAEALADIILSESISVTCTDSQQPQSEVKLEEINQQIADINILPKETVVSQTTIATESEGNYEQQETTYRNANTKIICLETSGQSQVIIQESEDILSIDKQPTRILANSSYSPNEPLTVEEIETGDTPGQFENYPKMLMDQASTNIETQEASNITETQVGESEILYEQQQPNYINIESTLTRLQEQLDVNESHILESEKVLSNFELPDSHKGKTVTSHTLPAGIIEETTIEYSTEQLQQHEVPEKKADINQNLHTETVISETIANEGLKKIELEKAVSKQALTTLLSQEALNVSEVFTDDKERQYIPGDLPSGMQATFDIDTQKVASKSVMYSNYATENLNVITPLTAEANSEQGTLETLQIIQHETVEKEGEHIESQPEKKQAAINLAESLTGINVSQIIPNEKENKYQPQPKPLEATASFELSTQEVIVKSEIETVVHADNIEEEEPLTGRAKKYARPFTELIVTETNIVDVEKGLQSDIFPFKKQANIDILPGQALSITETVTDHKEEPLEILETVSSLANINISEQQVAIKEEIQSNSLPGDLIEKSAEMFTASSHQDVSHPVIQLQFTLGEKEQDKETDVRPDIKQVNISFIETQSLNITEVNVDDKEQKLPQEQLPEGVKGESSISSHITALKEEVVSDDSVKKFEKPEHHSVKATPECTLLDSFVTTESMVIEGESKLKEIKPDEKVAHPEYQPVESISITSVTSGIKEGKLDKDQLNHETASSSFLPQDVVEVRETVASDTTTGFDQTSPTHVTAIQSQSEHKSIISMEAVVGESELYLKESVKPHEQKADVEYEHITTAQISETILNEKEDIQQTSDTVESKTATSSLAVQPVAETSITFAQDTISDVVKEVPVTAQADVEQSPFEGIIQTAPHIQESEKHFEKEHVDIKQAIVEFREDQSVMITQITSNETESSLDVNKKPKEKYADIDIDVHKISVNTEIIITNEAVNDINVLEPILTTAHPEVIPLNTAIKSETILTESEAEGDKIQKPETKQLSVSFDEGQSIIVQSVMTHDNETELIETPLEKMYAESNISDTNFVASQLETQVGDSLKQFETFKPDENKAKELAIPFDSAITTEQIAIETESELTECTKANKLSATVGIQPSEGVSTTETVTAQSENNLKEFKLPSPKTAQTAIDVTHKVAESNITDISEDTDIYKILVPESQNASEREGTFDSLIITENVLQEKENRFEGAFKPITSKGEVSLEQNKHSINVSEIIIQDKEGGIDKLEVPTQHKATMGVDSITLPEKSETLAEESIDETPSISLVSTKAALKHSPREEVIQIQPLVQETEGIFEAQGKPVTKNAEFAVEENKVVSTMEIVPAEIETSFEDFKRPDYTIAEPNLTTNISAETTEILVNMDTNKLNIDIPISATAASAHDTLDSFTQSIPMVIESSENFADKMKPTSEKAEEKINCLTEITVSEIYTETKANEFKEYPNKFETAIPQLDSARAVQQSEVLTSENINELKTVSKPLTSIKIEQDTFDSILFTENIIHESEKSFQESPAAEMRKADTVIDNISSLTVSEVISEEREKPLISEQTKEEFSTTAVLSNIPLSQSVVLSQENIDKFDITLPTEEMAQLTQSKYDSLIVTSNEIQETEIPIDDKYTETKKADISVSPEEHIYVTETMITDKESTFAKNEIITSVADKTVSPQEATQILETRSNQSLADLKEALPEQSKASTDHLPYHTVNITETMITEKEANLQKYDEPNYTRVDIALEKSGKAASVTETITNMHETPILEDRPNIDVATPLITEHTVVEERDIKVFEGLVDMPESKMETPRKATSQRDTYESIIETDVTVHGDAKSINLESPSLKTANIDIPTNESITVTEVTVQGQTGKEVVQVSARETTAQTEVVQRPVVINEEIIPLQSHDTFKSEKVNAIEGRPEYIDVYQHGLIVTEQKSTGNLGSLEFDEPTSKTVKIVMDEISPSLQISEVHLHELEGDGDVVIEEILDEILPERKTSRSHVDITEIDEGKKPETFTVQEITPENTEYVVEELPEETINKKKTEIVTKKDEKKPETTVTVQEIQAPKEITQDKPIYMVEELPEEIEVTDEITKDGNRKKKVIKKKIIKKQTGAKQERTAIVTVEEEGKKPETTVTVEELDTPAEPIYVVEELPEEVQVIEEITDGKRKKKIIKTKRVKKQSGQKQQETEIITVVEDGKTPETTVILQDVNMPEDSKLEKPRYVIEELPEEVHDTELINKEGKSKKKVIRRRVIKKEIGGKQEKTEIITTEEEGRKPETIATVQELEFPEENVSKQSTYVIQELPEEVEVTEVISKDGKSKKKRKAKKPETTVTVHQLDVPEETIPQQPTYVVEELPEEVQVTEVITREGKPKKKVIRKRVIKKQIGGKQEKTEIVTVEEEDKKPEITVTVQEFEVPEETVPEKSIYVVEELPEEVQVTEVITNEGKPKKKVIRKRIIKKQTGGKQEKTEIVTVEEEGKKPETTVTVQEFEIPEEIVPEKPIYVVEELPEEVQVTEVITNDGKPKKKVIRKRVIKKQTAGKQEKTEIVTVEEEGKKPETTVTVQELEIPEEAVPQQPAYVVEELPEEVQITEVITKEGRPKKKVIRKRVIKKQIGGKQETTEIVTVEEEDKIPETTVTVQELEIPEEAIPQQPIYVVEELPEEVQITEEITKEGKPKKKVIRKRVIKKQIGGKQEKTEIVTVEEEGRKPETTVTVQNLEVPDETIPEQPTYVVEELPEEVQVTQVITKEGKPKSKVIRKRVIRKQIGGKREQTEIITVEEEGRTPETTVTVQELEVPEDTTPQQTTYVVEELPEQVQVIEEITKEGKPKEKVIRKRVIKKQIGGKQEKTEIVTVEEEGRKPETTVTVQELEVPEETIPQQPTYVVEELPEEVQVTEEITKEGKPKKKIIKKRVIKKQIGGKQEKTEIVTVEEEGKKPETTVTVQELEVPEETIPQQPTYVVEELPEEVHVTEEITKEGKPKKKIIKKRVIKKQIGGKQEKTEIVTVEEEGRKPETTVTVQELEVPEETMPQQPTYVVEELPEEIQVTEEITKEGKPKKKIIKKRVIKKQIGGKQEKTEIVTVEEEGRKPETTVTIQELEVPEETIPQQPTYVVEELPEEVQVTEEITKEGKPKKKIIKKRVIKKQIGGKQEKTEIVTVEEEGRKPETTVTVQKLEVPEETIPQQPTYVVEELPEEVQVTEEITKEGKPKKKIIKKRVIKKQIGGKQEKTEIVTVEEEGKKPETTVTVQELEVPEETIPQQPTYVVEELPEEVHVTEEITKEGKPKKKVIRKRVIKKLIGGKQEKTEIVTVEEEGRNPETTITVQELEVPEETMPQQPTYVVEELPEEIQVTEEITKEGKPKKKIIKKRVIKKQIGGKQEKTEIVTVEEEGRKPETTVTVQELEVPEETIPQQPTYVVEELPEEVQVTEEITKEGKPKKKIIKKRVIKKQIGGKQEKTEIVTVEEEGKKPETTVTVQELEVPEETIPQQPTYVVEELPEEVHVTEEITKEGKPKKKVIRKRVIKKLIGGKQEKTEIVTVEEEGRNPETTITVQELEVPEETMPQQPTYVVEELPEEIQVTEEITKEGKTKKKIIKKRVIKKQIGGKQEKTEIVTVEEEGRKPETTVTVQEIEVPEETIPQQPTYVVEELPEEIYVTEEITKEGKPKKKVIRKRVIKKQIGEKQEKTEIVTVEEEGRKPETTVTVQELEVPEETIPQQPTYVVEELPEEVQVTEEITKEGKLKKKIIKKRVIKKQIGGKQERTEIVTVEEEGRKPETIVTVQEIAVPEEAIPQQPAYAVEELPEEVQVTEEITKEGKPKKKVIKKRVIKKQIGGKQEKTEIVTVEEEGRKPETTVTVQELELPAETVPEQTYMVEELPEEVQITEEISKEGKPKKKVIRKRVIKKQIGGKQERTEIITVEEEGRKPETTVTVQELKIPEETIPQQPTFVVEELPEEVQVIEVITKEGKPKKKVIRKRVIKKQIGGKQEKTEIVTVEEEGKNPETTVTIQELEVPEETAPEQPIYVVEELPEEVQVTEEITKEGKPKKKVIRKRVIKKQIGGKQEKTEIVSVEVEGRKPETTVTVQELEVPEETIPQRPTYVVEELPEEVQVTEEITKEGKPKKKVIRKRVIKKQIGGKQEKTEIVTVEEEGRKPETTVTVQLEVFEETIPEPTYIVEELPEEVQVTEVITEEGKSKKKVIKKRVIKKQIGRKQEKTEIVTVEEEGRKPETTVTVQELEIPAETVPKQHVYVVEELPEEVLVTEEITEEGKPKKKVIRKRVIKKQIGGKQEKTEIVTVEEEGKKPETTVTVQEVEVPEETEPEQPTYVVEELPEEVQISQEITKEGKPKKKVIRKRVIKKQIGGKQEKTEIVTVEEEGKKPETTVTVQELEVPEETVPIQPTYTVEELPEEVRVTEEITKEGKIKKKVIRKRVIKKQIGEKQENTEIITVEEEGRKPETTVTVLELEGPQDIISEQPTFVVMELPEEVQIKEVITKEGKPKRQIVRKRTIKKQMGKKQERTEILTVEEEGKNPETTVSIEEIDTPEEFIPLEEHLIEELPEVMQVKEIVNEKGKPTTQVIKKRVIKKRKGARQEITEILTVEEEGKEPQVSVYVKEESAEEIHKRKRRPMTKAKLEEIADTEKILFVPTLVDKTKTLQQPKVDLPKEFDIDELPEEVITETITRDGKPKKKVIKKRIIQKRKGSKQETTQILTVEEEGKKPETVVTVEELELPKEIIEIKPEQPSYIEELPEEVITETVTIDGKPKKKVIKKRIIQKRKGSKQETTQILTVEEEGKKPETTVTVEEHDLPKEVVDIKPEEPSYIEELPEEVITETVTRNGKPKKKVIKRRIIQKRKGSKQETTQILTVDEEGKEPETTVTVEELDLPKEVVEIKPEQPSYIEELPEEVITETVTRDGKPKKKVIKRRIIQKRKGSKQETTQILTVEEEGKKPETTVTVEELDLPKEVVEIKPEQPSYIEELPEEVTTETVTRDGKPKKKIIKKRIIQKRKGSKQEITQILTVDEEGKEPETTVTVEELDLPKEVVEIKPEQPSYIEELPEEVITETVTRDGSKQETTQILTVEEEGKKPETTVTVEELDLPKEVVEIKPEQPSYIEELPEEVTTETVTRNGKPKKKIIKKRIIQKRKGSKQEITQILTVDEEGKEPETTVTVEELDLPKEVVEIKPEQPSYIEELPEEVITETVIRDGSKQETTQILTVEEEGKKPEATVTVKELDLPKEIVEIKPEQPCYIEELPEEVTTETVTRDGKPKKKIIKKRIIQKRKGSKQETTQILTVEEEGKKPETTVTVEQVDLSESTAKMVMTVSEEIKELEKSVTVEEVDLSLEIAETIPSYIEELPEEIFVTETVTKDGKPKKKIIKKRILKKRKGAKQETTQIITVEEEGKKPESSITVEESDITKELTEKMEDQPTYLEELPEEVFETETITKDGKPKKEMEEEGKKPETIVLTEEIDLPKEIAQRAPVQASDVTELPEQVLVIETVTKEGSKQEITQMVEVTEEGKKPEYTITVEETDFPTEVSEESPEIEELPEEIVVTETVAEDGKPKKKVIKKRVIQKRKGSKQELTQIVTHEEEGKSPETIVTVEEYQIKETEKSKKRKPKKVDKKEIDEPEKILFVPTLAQEKDISTPEDVMKLLKMEIIRMIISHPLPEIPAEFDFPLEQCCILQELPEKVEIIDLPTGHKQIIRKRTIKKDKGNKDEIINIFRSEKPDEEPNSYVTIEEFTKPTEEVYPVVSVLELPEDIEVIEISTSDKIPKKKITKKRTFLKKVGPKVEATEIITILEDDKEPLQIVQVVEVKPTKLKILNKEEFPLLGQMKLKKPKMLQKKPKEIKFPKVRLTSRIRHITFPPESEVEKTATITILPPYIKDNGTLSRNIKEANEILKKKKPKKFKDIDRSLPDLEKLEDFEMPEKPKKEIIDEEFKYKKGSRETEKEDESVESVKLKQIPEKPKETKPDKDKDINSKPTVDTKVKHERPEEETEPIEFKPYDVERSDYDLEKPEKIRPGI
ncbi:hypothetical protein NQ314_007533 [Rhamnusium bicolor]|uniref:Ig-like domain-containing protein n=1 Tax=Rhamnusium bicolor TaxID=1586634 RepID=A0AAV8YP53_9CUCU|nr:hypothetical protein NQ314_007533 [Rhamnusium bicolor]